MCEGGREGGRARETSSESSSTRAQWPAWNQSGPGSISESKAAVWRRVATGPRPREMPGWLPASDAGPVGGVGGGHGGRWWAPNLRPPRRAGKTGGVLHRGPSLNLQTPRPVRLGRGIGQGALR